MASSPAASPAQPLGPQMWPPGESAALAAELTRHLATPPLAPLDIRISDIDDVHFRLESVPDKPAALRVSMAFPLWSALQSVGVEARLAEVYAPLAGATVVPPQDGAHFAVEVDGGAGSSSPPPTPLGELVRALAAMRRHAAEWPFLAAAQAVADGRGGATPALSFEARRGLPTYVVPRGDKLVVAFAVGGAEPTERALLRVVAQELAEAKVGGGSGGAPSVTFTDKPDALPLELRGLASPPPPAAASDGDAAAADTASQQQLVGYVTFTCFPRHVAPRAQAAATASALAAFRHYLDYHVAATKGYLHGRMRARLDGWLEGLKAAARDDAVAEGDGGGADAAKRVTVSGRSFVPKV